MGSCLHDGEQRAGAVVPDVAAQFEFESKTEANVQALDHIIVSSVSSQVLPTWDSSVQPAPPYRDI